jgi:hypothetical protein
MNTWKSGIEKYILLSMQQWYNLIKNQNDPPTCPKDGMDSYVWRILSSLHWKDNLPLLLIKQEHIWNGRWFPVARQNFLILFITSIFTPTISWLTFWVLWPKGSVFPSSNNILIFFCKPAQLNWTKFGRDGPC